MNYNLKKVKIIAEAGVNHNGSLNIAKKLIKAAKGAKADFVKFQIFKAESVVTKEAKKSNYQKKNSKDKEKQIEMIKRFQLPYSSFRILKKECFKNKINFLCSPFDIESAEFLQKLGEKTIKIPSGEITNYPLLRRIGKMKLNIILSTGMSNFLEINDALKILINNGTKKNQIILLHCNTSYPTPPKDANLLAIKQLREKFNISTGYSDHTLGIEMPIGAVCLGATVIEKHLTLDNDMEGPDHKSSLSPNEFASMVACIRNIEKGLVPLKKKLQKSEKGNIKVVRKSIVANLDIKKGDFFNEKNITTKRPGTGISPMKWKKILGKKAKKNFKKDEIIK
jgi:N,N'-diacetyllegionaminate synthase